MSPGLEFYDLTVQAEIYDVIADIENGMLMNIGKVFRSNKNDIGSVQWEIEKLSMAGRLTRSNLNVIAANADRSYKAIEKEFIAMGHTVIKNNTALLKNTVSVGNMQAVDNIAKAYAKNAYSGVNLSNTAALQAANREFINVVNKTVVSVSRDIVTPQEALKQALSDLGGSGLKIDYVSESGRRTSTTLDVAVRRDIRTTSAQVSREIQLSKNEEWGVDLIEISSHYGARPKCEECQGKIYSLSGQSTKYPAFSEST